MQKQQGPRRGGPQLSLFDAKSLKNVWLGTGAGTSDNADARVASQLVVTHILGRFPNRTDTMQSDIVFKGVVGVQLLVFTNDGDNYVPTVLSVSDGGPAARAGVKAYDMILSIDGVQVVNKPFTEVIQLLAGEPGTPTSLQLWRTGQQLTVNVTRVNRSDVRW